MRKAARALLLFFSLFLLFILPAKADELLDIQREIEQKNKEYSQTQSTISQLKKQVASLSGSVYTTRAQLDEANRQLAVVKDQLAVVETDLNKKRDELLLVMAIRDEQIRYLYKHPGDNPLELFLAADGLAGFSLAFGWQERILEGSKDLVSTINEEFLTIEKTRDEVASLKNALEATAAAISAQLASLQYRVSANTGRQSVLSSQLSQIESNIKNLTEKQKQLIAAKLAASSQPQTLGDQVPPSTPLPDPGFSPAFAFASYGYPHRVGMNQYGAYGRARAGQDYQTILRTYYRGIGVGGYPVPATINVAGVGLIPFEDNYLKGIAEMPSSWPLEAQKAQAVAARSYALNWLASHPGGAICTTQSCQVYNSSKVGNPAASIWHRAVEETRGIVATYAGAPIAAWYSSTAGGYTLSSQEVWGGFTPYAVGTPDFSGSWPGGAYDKDSPWFHKAWGDKTGGTNCRRGGYFPWLTRDETADLFNALLLSKANPAYNQNLSPPDGCNSSARGWSRDQVAGELRRIGIADVGTVFNIFVGYDGAGHTSSITVVSSNYSAKTFSGQEFRSMFNLRSIGNLVLWSNLYDVIIR